MLWDFCFSNSKLFSFFNIRNGIIFVIVKFSRTYTLKEIATLLNLPYIGDDEFPVLGMNEIHVVENGDIVFVDHPCLLYTSPSPRD